MDTELDTEEPSPGGSASEHWADSALWRWLPRRIQPLAGACLIVAVLVAWFAGNMWVANLPLGTFSTDVHLDLQFLGATATPSTVDLGDVQRSLWLDVGVAVAYGVVFTWLLAKIPTPGHIDQRLVTVGGATKMLPAVAAALDVVENLLLLLSVESATSSGETNVFVVDPEWLGWVVTAIAITKWVALGASLLVVLWWGASALSPRPTLRSDQGASEPHPNEPTDGTGLAVCCSGGGIRSAGFSIGALRALENAGIMDRVDTIASVSGGNYAATGWVTHRYVGGEGLAADRLIDRLLHSNPFVGAEQAIGAGDARIEQARADVGLDEPNTDQAVEERSVRKRQRAYGRHRFLLNGPGGLRRALLWAAAAIASTVLQIVVVTVVIGWPLGYFLASDVMYPTLDTALLDGTGDLPIERRHWVPIVMLLGAGVVMWFVSAIVDADPSASRIRRQVAKWALLVTGGTLGVGLLAGLVLIVGPWLLVQVYAIGSGANESPLFTVGGISLLTVLGVVFQVIRNPLRSRWSRLGGVALVLLVLALIGKVVRDAATGQGAFGDAWVAWVAVGALFVVTFLPDTQTWSIRELYRARLTKSFAPEEFQPLSWRKRTRPSTEQPVGVEWNELSTPGPGGVAVPELVVSCAASRVGLSTNGVSAESFTISQREVRHHRAAGTVAVPTGSYLERFRSWALIPLRSPAGWMATSGAAVASGMGRTDLGSTNSLLAAVNADLGVWLPSPAKVDQGSDEFPPVRIGHLVAEIFGLYSEDDEFIFVSDGGHLENTGLVEALRSEPTTVICIDASGDEPGSFATLRSALRMADTELETRLEFDLTELDESELPAATSIYRIPFHARGNPAGRVGEIIFLKLQNTLDQPRSVRQMANADPRFPNYSTANQLLNDQQFVFLLVAGHHAGELAAERMRERAGSG